MPVLAAIGEGRQSTPVVSVGYDLPQASGDDLEMLHVTPDEAFYAHRASMADLPEEFATVTIDQEAAGAKQFATAVELDARYLVIGGRRRSPAGTAIFGSRTHSILLESDSPVVTVMIDG